MKSIDFFPAKYLLDIVIFYLFLENSLIYNLQNQK